MPTVLAVPTVLATLTKRPVARIQGTIMALQPIQRMVIVRLRTTTPIVHVGRRY